MNKLFDLENLEANIKDKEYKEILLVLSYNKENTILIFPLDIDIKSYTSLSSNSSSTPSSPVDIKVKENIKIIYKELLSINGYKTIKENFISVKDPELTDKKEIISNLNMLKKIIDSFSLENYDNIINELDVVILLSSFKFFFNLNLISFIKISLEILINKITNDKFFLMESSSKASIYISLIDSIAVIQKELLQIKCSSNQILKKINSLMSIYDECIKILILILIAIEKVELELFVDTIKNRYFIDIKEINIDDIEIPDDKNYETYGVTSIAFKLLINIMKILFITLINNEIISINDKPDIIKNIVISQKNNKKIRLKCLSDNNILCVLINLSQEIFKIYDSLIQSNVLARAYNQVNIEKDDYDVVLKIVKLYIEIQKDYNVIESLSASSLIDKINNINIIDFNSHSNINRDYDYNNNNNIASVHNSDDKISSVSAEINDQSVIQGFKQEIEAYQISIKDKNNHIKELIEENSELNNKVKEIRESSDKVISDFEIKIESLTKRNDNYENTLGQLLSKIKSILKNDDIDIDDEIFALLDKLQDIYVSNKSELERIKKNQNFLFPYKKLLLFKLISFNCKSIDTADSIDIKGKFNIDYGNDNDKYEAFSDDELDKLICKL